MRRPTLPDCLPSLLLFAACAASPEGPAPYELDASHRAGTVLTGPVGEAPELAEAPWFVELSLVRFDECRPEGEPLAAYVRRAVTSSGDAPLVSRGELAAGVRVLDTSPNGDASWARREVGFLWPGTSVAWSLAPAADPARTAWERFGLELARTAAADDLRAAVWFEGLVTPRLDPDEGLEGEVRAAPRPERRRERLVLDAPALAGDVALRLFLPAPRPLLPDAADVLEVRLVRTPDLADPDLAAALARAERALEESVRRARPAPPEAERPLRLERASAVDALARRTPHREALLFLADATQASLALDLALVARDGTLAAYQEALRPTLDAPEAREADTAGFGWRLDRATWRWLAGHVGDDGSDADPELAALLLRRAGEVARTPDVLLELVAACAGPAALEERLLAENRVLLEDGRPGARVRAYDWLALRGVAPASFDPLGTREERRAALKALEAKEGAR